jgi:hypothetical protein
MHIAIHAVLSKQQAGDRAPIDQARAASSLNPDVRGVVLCYFISLHSFLFDHMVLYIQTGKEVDFFRVRACSTRAALRIHHKSMRSM